MSEHEQMLMKALSAVTHLIEFMDTGHGLDLTAAWSSLNDADLREWIEKNGVLLPLRRDHQSLLVRIDEDKQ